MLNPANLIQIQADFNTLLNGPDGQTVTVTDDIGGTVDPVYGDVVGGSVNSRTTRAHLNKIFHQGEISSKRFADVIEGDAIILLPTSFSIAGLKNVKIIMQNSVVYVPVQNPPEVAAKYAALAPNGQQFVQAVYCRLFKGS